MLLFRWFFVPVLRENDSKLFRQSVLSVFRSACCVFEFLTGIAENCKSETNGQKKDFSLSVINR